nr:site-specific integrase [Mesorhizobium kowhaii]
MGKLTDTWLKRTKIASGIYGDGDRLYLRVQGKSRAWLFIYTSSPADGKRRRELGLGGYPAVSLANARRAADKARDILANGNDPIAVKHEVAVEVVPPKVWTLQEVCEEYIVAKSSEWNAAGAARYRGYVANHLTLSVTVQNGIQKSEISNVRAASPREGQRCETAFPLSNVTVADIERWLKPVWHTPTGPYLRSFLERVIDYAMVKGYMPQGLNPARYRGHLEHVLPRVKRVTRSHEAMPWADVPTCYAGLTGYAANALRFTILTAARQVEVREMRWREVDLAAGLWRIPAERYKTRREHIVPLSPQALAVLGPVGKPDDLVFEGCKKGRPISQHIFKGLLNGEYDPHGFRTSFVVWCVEAGGFTDELAQRCLGHIIGTATTRAYQRSDFIAQRRACLEAWAAFVGNSSQG